jgi:hypothetical protein
MIAQSFRYSIPARVPANGGRAAKWRAPPFTQWLIDTGIEPTLDSTPEKFRRSLAADVALWTPVVQASSTEQLRDIR